jgi:hypothetical protein
VGVGGADVKVGAWVFALVGVGEVKGVRGVGV